MAGSWRTFSERFRSGDSADRATFKPQRNLDDDSLWSQGTQGYTFSSSLCTLLPKKPAQEVLHDLAEEVKLVLVVFLGHHPIHHPMPALRWGVFECEGLLMHIGVFWQTQWQSLDVCWLSENRAKTAEGVYVYRKKGAECKSAGADENLG